MQPKKKSLVVVKSNKLIEARYDLSVNELRLILTYISLLNPKDEQRPCVVEMKVMDYIRILDLENRNDIYNQVKEASQKLIEKSLAIQEKDGLLITTWFSSIKYFDKKGTVRLKSSDDLIPYLFDLKNYFTQYKLFNIVRLKSQHSIRMYELLKQYEKVGKRTISITELRSILGIPDNEYPLYGNFKKRVILSSQSELKQKTDIKFAFEESKKIRKKVEEITFYIYENKEYEKPANMEELLANSEICATSEIPGQLSIGSSLIENINLSELLNGFSIQPDFIKKYNISIEQLQQYISIITQNKAAIKKDPSSLLAYSIQNNLSYESLKAILKSKKTINMTNFNQREYNDEYYDSLYENT